MSLELPVSPELFLQCRASAAWFSVCTIICSHNCFHIRFLHQTFKCRQISFFHIFCRCLCIKFMADCLRSGMYCEMFGTCRRFHCFSVTLKCLYKSHSQFLCQIWIFSISFMPSAPSGITENIYVGRPECQSFIDISVLFAGICIILCTPFCRYNICHLSYTVSVKCSSHSDCLRKNSCLSRSGHAMKSLIPPVICRDSKSFYGRCIIS